jgi:[methyl-Co(III) methanol-specific corrinoid protein]:coenzyme M methyltransferase
MMAGATMELLQESGYTWEAVNRVPAAMAAFARTIQRTLGVDNVGVPFCMTVEAECLGSTVELGSPLRPPRIEQEACPDLPTGSLPQRQGRMPVVLEAISILADQANGACVTGNVVGPVSLGAMVVEPGRFWRAIRRRPHEVETFLSRVTDFVVTFAEAQVAAGAELVVVAEPSGTGEILGPSAFERFVIPNVNRISRAVQQAGALSAVHICGQVRAVAGQLALLEADALSVDAMVDADLVRTAGCRLPLMGNVSTFVLHKGPREAVERAVVKATEQGFAILAPACGVSGATPTEHLQALVQASRDFCDTREGG